MQVLTARLAGVERRIEAGHPAIVVGGRRLAKNRHNLADAGLTERQWRERWDARRMFLTADGESGAPYGNYTIAVDPADGTVTIVLPEPLRHLANAPRGRYRLACTVTFNHRQGEWLDRITANRSVRYDLVCDPDRGRWYLDASWSTPGTPLPTPAELAATGVRLLAVDLNAGHLAACVVDIHGNPVGRPITVTTDLSGPTSRRDGRLRQAISELIHLAHQHGCAGFAIENLGFADARATGRETMGRGKRGKTFRANCRRTAHGEVPRPACRHGPPCRPDRGRGRPCVHLPLGSPALEAAAPAAIEDRSRYRPPCGGGGDRQTCPRTRDTASARCDRTRPEDRRAESYRPDRHRTEGTRDREPAQDHRHTPPG
ncbi:hypothetical protein [Streptomyces sp. NPDC059957]|uniref:hypothetical protein n=1 Tax=unclassified Streptomyces TaxID=2593676 RepID=UPI00365114D4